MARPRSENSEALIERMHEIAEEVHPISVRGVAYKLFSEGLIEDMKAGYRQTSRLLTIARREGRIPFAWIVDESRMVRIANTFSAASEFSRNAVNWFRLDPWEGQHKRVEVWSEKATVSGVLAPILREHAVSFRNCKGFASATFENDAVEMMDDNCPLVVLYVGDWDPSGTYMSMVDLPGRLLAEHNPAFRLHRVALTLKDAVALHNANLGFDSEEKKLDPRMRWWHENERLLGTQCAELDALDANVLRDRVRVAIEAEITDREAWDRVLRGEEAQRKSLETYLAAWQRAEG